MATDFDKKLRSIDGRFTPIRSRRRDTGVSGCLTARMLDGEGFAIASSYRKDSQNAIHRWCYCCTRGNNIWVFPPKKINGHYGYRTKASMKSQEAWDVAQKCSAKMMLVFGILCLVVDWMMLRMFPNLTFLHQYLYVQVPGMVVSFICMIIFTEFALRRVNK